MPLSMSQFTLPALTRTLGNLRAILEKAEAHARELKIDERSYTGFRLFPDMRPLTFQVQVACDMSKGCVARLSGVEAPKFEDTEQTFAELRARIDRTLEFLRGVSPGALDGTEAKAITIKTPRGDLNFEGLGYVQAFVLPNVYFHVTTAYNILRHNGVALGKMDYLGQP